jgi:hypothetical protein
MEPKNEPEKKPKPPKKRRKTPEAKSIEKDKLEKDVAFAALSAFFGSPERKKDSQHAKALHGAIGEYLSSYIIIGYMMNGKPVATTYANNQRDLDALNTGLQKFLMDSYSRHNFPPGNFD